jgi:hypothetical protein
LEANVNQDLVNVVESLGGKVLLGGALVQFTDTTFMDALKKIYESGVLSEREACAKLCFEMWNKWMDADPSERDNLPRDADDCAAAIRARGQA